MPGFLLPALLTGVGLAGSLASRGRRLRPQDVEIGALDQVQSLLDLISDPGFGRERFLEMAAASRPTTDSILGAIGARGGSTAQGLALSDAQALQSREQALDAFERFQQGLVGQRGNLLSLLTQGQQFQRGALLQDRQNRQNTTGSFFNQIAGLGGTLLGAQFLGRQGSDASANLGQAVALPQQGLQFGGGFGGNLFPRFSPGQSPNVQAPRGGFNFTPSFDLLFNGLAVR